MYNLPYVSYGIFAFVVIATIVLGIKKGFKVALYSFALVLAATGIAIGITIGLYDKISPLFTDLIVSHFGGNSSFDFSAMADNAKPQVISICVAIGLIPIMGVLFGISYPMYKLFKKWDNPRTLSKLSTFQKKVKFRNQKFNKVGSVVATSITAVATGSVVATATSSVLTTSKTFNLFNEISSKVSTGMTFGFGYDNMAIHRLYDLIPLTNDLDLMDTFAKIIAPKATSTKTGSSPVLSKTEVDQMMANENFGKLRSILEETSVSTILNVIYSKYHIDTENITYPDSTPTNAADDLSISQRLYGFRPLGDESYDSVTPYLYSVTELDRIYSSTGLHLGLSETKAAEIIDWIRGHSVQKFEDTEVYTRWKNKGNAILELQRQLTTARNEFATRIDKANQLKQAFDNSKAEFNSFITSVNADIAKFNELSRVGGTIDSLVASIAQLQKIESDKNDVNVAAKKAFDDYQTFTFGPSQATWNTANANLNTSKQNLAISESNSSKYKTNMDSAQRDLDGYNATKSSLEAVLATLPAQISSKDAMVANLQSEVNALVTQKQAAQTEYMNAHNGVASKQIEIDAKKSQITALQHQIQSTTDAATLATLNQQLSTLNANLSTLNSEITSLKSIETSKKAVYDSIAATWSSKTKELSQVTSERNALVSEQTSKQNQLNQVKVSITNQQSIIASWKKQYDDEIAKQQTLRADVVTSQAHFDNADADFKAKQTESNRLNSILGAASQALDDAHAASEAAKAKKVEAETNRASFMRSITAFATTGLTEKQKNITDAFAQWSAMDWRTNNPSTKIDDVSTASINDLNSPKVLTGLDHDRTYNNVQIVKDGKTFTVDLTLSFKYEESLQASSNPTGSDLPTIETTDLADDGITHVKEIDRNKQPAPAFGTKGKVEELEFIIQEAGKSKNYLNRLKDDKQVLFNKNIDIYLDTLKKYLL